MKKKVEEKNEIRVYSAFSFNQPPDDFHCVWCKRKFENLPHYPNRFSFMGIGTGCVVEVSKGKRWLKLYKEYWEEGGCVSAIWVCFDCFKEINSR